MGLFGYCVLARVRWYDPLALRPVFNPRWPLAAACFWQNFFLFDQLAARLRRAGVG